MQSHFAQQSPGIDLSLEVFVHLGIGGRQSCFGGGEWPLLTALCFPIHQTKSQRQSRVPRGSESLKRSGMEPRHHLFPLRGSCEEKEAILESGDYPSVWPKYL